MRIKIFTYCLKVWLTSVLIASLLVALQESIFVNHHFSDLYSFYLLLVVFSSGFSIPSVILLWVAANILRKTAASLKVKKLILSAISAMLTWIAFYLAEEAFSANEMFALMAVYFVVILAGIWYYKLPASRVQANAV